MVHLTEENALEYLVSIGEVEAAAGGRVRKVAGGVSNIVLRVTSGDRDMVLKQALARLNVAEEWLAKVERLHTEVACLRLLEGILPAGSVPGLIFFDEENHIYGMGTVSDSHTMWKSQLLDGRIDPNVVERVAQLLAHMHTATWGRADIARRFDDMDAFWQLRVDPYYGTIHARHPDVAGAITSVIDGVRIAHYCLVHGDYSPKNVLVENTSVVLLDFEVAHYGDPAFDVAFMLNHLLLKAVHVRAHADRFIQAARLFWSEYTANLSRGTGGVALPELEQRTLRHLGCLQLARVDGKSPVEYLTDREKETVKHLAKRTLRGEATTLNEAIEMLSEGDK